MATGRYRSLEPIDDGSTGFNTFKRVLSERMITKGHIKILLTGRVGMGKSALINSIIELGRPVAEERGGGSAVTSEVETHKYCITNDVTLSLIDTPGLSHFEQQHSQFFETLFEDMMIQGENISLVLYCRKMTDQRFEEDEIVVMRKLYHQFGPQFWERVVIVLTFANLETCEQVMEGDPPLSDVAAWEQLIRRRFTELLRSRCQELKDILKRRIPIPAGVVDQIRFIPAGHYVASLHHPQPFRLPDRENWLYDLLYLSCNNPENLVNLSKLTLRENLHLAIIIDNEGVLPNNEVKVNTNDEATEATTVKLNQRAKALKESLNREGQLVFTFNSLSPQSIHLLLRVINNTISSAELAAFMLIILCNEKTCEELKIQEIFDHYLHSNKKVPKIFYTHFNKPKKAAADLLLQQSSFTYPSNSIILNVVSMSDVQPGDTGLQEVTLFNEAIKNSFVRPSTECFNEMKEKVHTLEGKYCSYEETFGQNSTTLPTIYEPSTSKAKLDFSKKKLDIQRVIWRKIRCDTVTILAENKDEIRKLLRNERIARITAAVTGMIIGGGLVIGGIAAAPFTFGASIGLAVAGGAVGVASSAGGIGALITRKVMANDRLKKAQEQVTFDQQLSMNVNTTVLKYYKAVDIHLADITAEATGIGVANTFAAGGRIGMAAAIGAEGAAEAAAMALRAGGRVAGMALAGVSLAVTVPIDIAFIAYHSYRIHQAKGDESGAKENDSFVRWFIQQIEGLLLDSITLDKHDYIVEAALNLHNFGFHMQVAVPDYSITVRTLFSGPFMLPQGTTLVSAVYDVSISKKLEHPVNIDIEHCVDVASDRSITRKMSFAVGKLDFVTKAYTFKLLKGGSIDDDIGRISVKESGLLCIVFTEELKLDSPMKYTAICGHERIYRNSWNMKIMFTKNLKAHFQFIQREFPVYYDTWEVHQFKFIPPCNGIQLEQFKQMSIQKNNWMIEPVKIPKAREISRKQLGNMEIQSRLSDSPLTRIPSIDLCVQVSDEETAADEFNYTLRVEGTDLKIPINRMKEMKPRI